MSEQIFLINDEELVKRINKLRREHRISQKDIEKATGIDQSVISRMLHENRNEPSKCRDIRYFEAQEIVNAILNLISPFPNRPLSDIYTPSEKVEKGEGFAYSDEKVKDATEKMSKKGFTQLIIKDRRKDAYVGILTDYAILKKMSSPTRVSKDWIGIFKEQEIGSIDLVDTVPTYPLSSRLMEVAEGLMHHYAVIIEEPSGKYGIITRNDFLKLLS